MSKYLNFSRFAMKSGGFLWYAVVGMINADNVKNNSNAKAVLDEMLAWTALQ